MASTVVPPLQLAPPRTPEKRVGALDTSRAALYSPRTQAERLALYASPRGVLYSPRTHRENLDLTGAQLNDALDSCGALARDLSQLSARAQRQRNAFAAASAPARDGSCPICMETIKDPLACSNNHRFCGDCLRNYRQRGPLSPRLLCPLCRVAMPEPRSSFRVT